MAMATVYDQLRTERQWTFKPTSRFWTSGSRKQGLRVKKFEPGVNTPLQWRENTSADLDKSTAAPSF